MGASGSGTDSDSRGGGGTADLPDHRCRESDVGGKHYSLEVFLGADSRQGNNKLLFLPGNATVADGGNRIPDDEVPCCLDDKDSIACIQMDIQMISAARGSARMLRADLRGERMW